MLVRNGHTEATVDLMRLAGLKECGVCCEIMEEDGTMMRTTKSLEAGEEVRPEIYYDQGSAGLLQESMKNMWISRQHVQNADPEYGRI